MNEFVERNEFGSGAEEFVRMQLEARGWVVHKWGRSGFTHPLNSAISNFKDTYSRPCRLRWLPDFLVVRPGKSQTLMAVDVKRCGTGRTWRWKLERSALNTYLRIETALWLPVRVVFVAEDNELLTIAAGQASIATKPEYGSKDAGSGTPCFHLDPTEMQAFDDIFGVKS